MNKPHWTQSKEFRFGIMVFCLINLSNLLGQLGYSRWLAFLPLIIALPVLLILYRQQEKNWKDFLQTKLFTQWYNITMFVLVLPLVILTFYL
ncbi:MAG TPA: hypothetical protein VJ953_01590 [Saprospiraceae bacterium]|nr:hypothetical protein [Saprospiraceae bacterium]